MLYVQVRASGKCCPSGYVLEPVLFSIFINGIDSEIECTLSKFADSSRVVQFDTMERRDAIQRDQGRL